MLNLDPLNWISTLKDMSKIWTGTLHDYILNIKVSCSKIMHLPGPSKGLPNGWGTDAIKHSFWVLTSPIGECCYIWWIYDGICTLCSSQHGFVVACMFGQGRCAFGAFPVTGEQRDASKAADSHRGTVSERWPKMMCRWLKVLHHYFSIGFIGLQMGL